MFFERPFAVTFWDHEHPGDHRRRRDEIRSPTALAHILRSPGELGIGRAYVTGLLDVDDVDAALPVVTDRSRPRS